MLNLRNFKFASRRNTLYYSYRLLLIRFIGLSCERPL